MSQSTSSDQPDGLADKATPGERLRKARVKLGLSREEIAVSLKLDVAKIVDLETDDVASIAAPVFLSGYLRAYARLVDLPGDELAADFDVLVKMGSPSSSIAAAAAINNFGRVPDQLPAHMSLAKRSWTGAALGIVVVLAAVIAGGWWWTDQNNGMDAADIRVQDETLPANPQVEEKNDIESTENLDVPPSPGVGEVENFEKKEFIPVVQTDNEDGVAPEVRAGEVEHPHDNRPLYTEQKKSLITQNSSQEIHPPESEDALSARKINAIEVEPSVNQSEIPRNQVTLVFTEDSWVEVNDAMGRRLMFGLGKAGEVKSISGVAPFEVYLGYVRGVGVSINGEVYDLSRFASRRTARFQLGESTDKQEITRQDNG